MSIARSASDDCLVSSEQAVPLMFCTANPGSGQVCISGSEPVWPLVAGGVGGVSELVYGSSGYARLPAGAAVEQGRAGYATRMPLGSLGRCTSTRVGKRIPPAPSLSRSSTSTGTTRS